MEEDEIPLDFYCPITDQVMIYPFITEAGSSYEWSAIKRWLDENSTDPLTNKQLKDKSLRPNNTLRAHILAWFENRGQSLPSSDATRPPPDAFGSNFKPVPQQDKVIRYNGTISRKELRKKRTQVAPPEYSAYSHRYSFEWRTVTTGPETGGPTLFVKCETGTCIEMPDNEMFVTERGIVFYDSTETRDTRVLPDTDFKEQCKFGTRCSNDGCSYAHPFVCPKGVGCQGCKFFHPDASSVVPVGDKFPLNTTCKYGPSCSLKGCMFAHPLGRLKLERRPARVFITHSLTLEKLPQPIPLTFNAPEKTKQFQFQGEFVFFFQPYQGTWAKDYYQYLVVHRYDPEKQCYREVGTYSLDGHYCNAVVGADRYIVVSFWPYDDEVARAVWENQKTGRAMEKVIRAKTIENQKLQSELSKAQTEISSLKSVIAAKDNQIHRLQGQIGQQKMQMSRMQAHSQRAIAAAQRQTWQARQEKAEAERRWRRARQDYERARMERYRLRDPIHIFALQAGRSGFAKDDWKLVLDYHKGAHDLRLHKANAFEPGQRLEVTEHGSVFLFDLVVPQDVSVLGSLPVVPERLCADF